MAWDGIGNDRGYNLEYTYLFTHSFTRIYLRQPATSPRISLRQSDQPAYVHRYTICNIHKGIDSVTKGLLSCLVSVNYDGRLGYVVV